MSAPVLSTLQQQLLVCQAQRGDTAAFRALVTVYEMRLLYFVRRFEADEHRAADLLQEIWLAMFQQLPRLRSPAAFRSWLYRIAHDRAVTQIRQELQTDAVVDTNLADRDVESIDEFTRQEEAAAVHTALARLTPDHRAVLTLRFLEDLSLEEIAEVTQQPLGTVKSRLHYAKEALRRLLSEEFLNG